LPLEEKPHACRDVIPDPAKFVEPDRVRKEVYTDAQIFEREMERIHETVWIYCGHESQVPKAGDYYTVQIGRQPMIMVRGANGRINVLYNRCPHRGNMICGDTKGNTGEASAAPTTPGPSTRRQAEDHPDEIGLRGHALRQRTTRIAA
jgi:hypothetical protein